jgi:RimJ/RimL family protein N-acetyltransferase
VHPIISTARLDLIPLEPEVLRRTLARDHAAIESLLKLTVPGSWYNCSRLIKMRLGQLEANPELQPWLLRAMAVRSTHEMAGYIGFHDAPTTPNLKSYSERGVELGYEVFPAHQRRGYATEACQALMMWARQEHAVRDFFVSISPQNAPSLAMARKLNFQRVGSHIDDVDGPEEIFKLTIAPSVLASALKLVPKTAEEARAMVEAMAPLARAQLSPRWLSQLYSPTVDHWTLGYTLVRAEDGAPVGQCAFKSPPMDGVVEIAYGVAPEFEGRGYATEAARALVRIAFENSEVQAVIAHTSENTNASSRVLLKAGFRSIGQVTDPEDGLVWKWERKREPA